LALTVEEEGGEWVKFEKSESYREKKRERKEPLESSP
jgi:hypothetical protein